MMTKSVEASLMEMKGEIKMESFVDFDKMGEESAYSLLKTGIDSVLLPPQNGKIASTLTHFNDTIHSITAQSRPQSFDLKRESPRERNIQKLTKSLSDNFTIYVDKLTNNVNLGSFEETSSILNEVFSSEIGFLSLNEDDDDRVNDDSIQNDNQIDKSSEIESEDIESYSWKKMNMEPTLPIYLKFEDVRYKVQVKGSKKENWNGGEKCILQGISGIVSPGEILALMGPSGGGKTTLLNLLSGRFINNNTISGGTITYNDQPYTKSLKKRETNLVDLKSVLVSHNPPLVIKLYRIGFVLQDDVVFPHLTVKETLTYAALLRLPTSLSKDQKKERAMDVIGELGLQRCQNTKIGGEFVRGISGGERKRVCIGNEILLNPSLLFLDEPTSGLDSTTALQIVQLLHNIAKVTEPLLHTVKRLMSRLKIFNEMRIGAFEINIDAFGQTEGKTVVTTIHQPSSRLFTKFDNLILLGKGSTLYSGKASEAMPYFSSIGCSPRIALNPAEFLIDLANGNMKDTSVPSELQDKFLAASCRNLKTCGGGPSPGDVHQYLVAAYESQVAKMRKTKQWKPLMIDEEVDNELRECGAPWLDQFCVLFRRGIKERRHENLSSLRFIQVISTAVIVGLLWFRSDSSSPSDRHDQEGLLFFISVFWGFFPLLTAIFTFPQERAMLVKERSVGMYKLSAYLLARNISDLPLDLILPTLFLLILYFMVPFKSSFIAFSFTLLTIFLTIIASQGLGLTIGAAFMEVKKATTFASITLMTFMLSSGFFIQNVPSFMSWIRYISFNYHTYRLLLKVQYSYSNSTALPGPMSTSSASSDQHHSSFVNAGKWVGSGGAEVGAMLLMIVGYRILAYLFLRKMKLRTII